MANQKRTRQNKRFAELHGNITRSEWAKQKKEKRREQLESKKIKREEKLLNSNPK